MVMVDKAGESHLVSHPDVIKFLPEAISKFNVKESKIREDGVIVAEVNLGRIIGKTGLIKTNAIKMDEETLFSYRHDHSYPTRVVKGEGEDCDTITLAVKPENNKWALLTAYLGYICPDEPFYIKDHSSAEFKESLNFWSTHALAYDPAVMQEPFTSTWRKESAASNEAA